MEAFDALLEELGRKGFAPVPKDRDNVPHENCYIIDLRGGLSITVVGELTRTLVYVGPDNDDTHRDVGAVKRVVDDMLGGSRG